jgi:hypothetical protein
LQHNFKEHSIVGFQSRLEFVSFLHKLIDKHKIGHAGCKSMYSQLQSVPKAISASAVLQLLAVAAFDVLDPR